MPSNLKSVNVRLSSVEVAALDKLCASGLDGLPLPRAAVAKHAIRAYLIKNKVLKKEDR